MKLLITGGNGFLGKAITEQLKSTAIEYLTPRSSDMDVLDFDVLCSYLKEHRPDSILHAAAIVGGILANANSPADFLRANTQMGLNVYEAARLCGTKSIYSLGSVCMYPKYCSAPFREDDMWNGFPEETNAPYGQAKRTLLMLSKTYRQQHGIAGAFLVPVNLYGPNDHCNLTNSHVIPALIRKFDTAASNGLPSVECWGTGKQGATREFLYVNDCATAIIKAISTNLDTDLPINLGVGKDISIYDLAHLIAELTGYTGEITFNGKFDGQPKRLLDVSRAKEMLEWEAKIDFRTGLKETIDWYRANKHLID